jgi:hypothetical protein
VGRPRLRLRRSRREHLAAGELEEELTADFGQDGQFVSPKAQTMLQ